MAPHLQHLSVLCPVGAERPTAVSGLALRGGRHGQLVWQDRVGDLCSLSNTASSLTSGAAASVQPGHI